VFRPRIMPCLLLKGKGLVKTVKFKDPTYLGDPINAVRIFNERESDELIFLDITATKENRTIGLDVVKNIGDECFMPFAVGGGIQSIETIKQIFNAGAEKVVLNSYAIHNPDFVKEAANIFGRQSIVVSIDVKKKLFGKYEVYTHAGQKSTKLDPVEVAQNMQTHGVGEILINSIAQDGTQQGFDIDLVKQVSDSVEVPVIACGGAGKMQDLSTAIFDGNASAVAAGSLFVFHGPRRAVLINYPTQPELEKLFKNYSIEEN